MSELASLIKELQRRIERLERQLAAAQARIKDLEESV